MTGQPWCTCEIVGAGGAGEYRCLDRACPVHGDHAVRGLAGVEHGPAGTPIPDCAADTDRSVMGLAGRWWRHVLALLDHRHGIDVLDRAELGAHALAALAEGQALTEDLQRWRPRLVVDALAAGADHATVAGAAGFDSPAQLCAWLLAWAGEQFRLGLINGARYAEVRALAELPERGAG